MRIELHDVPADDLSLQPLDDVDRLPGRQAAGLAVGDAGRERRIETVEIERHIDGTVEAQRESVAEVAHLDHLDPESRGLLPLVRRRRPDADLHETRGQPGLHDAGEGTGVREPIAAELVVEIGMRVEMEDGEPRIFRRERPDDRVRDRVVASERQRRVPLVEKAADRGFDSSEDVAPVLGEIARVEEGLPRQLPSIFGP